MSRRLWPIVLAMALSGCLTQVLPGEPIPNHPPGEDAVDLTVAPAPEPMPAPAPTPPAPTPPEPAPTVPATAPGPGGLTDEDVRTVVEPPTRIEGPALSDSVYDRNMTWRFDGRQWSYDMQISTSAYDAFRERPRVTTLTWINGSLYRQAAYDIYVSEPQDNAVIDDMARRFSSVAQAQGWDDRQTVAFLLAFVQSLPYTADDVTSGFDEYPRYPLETLVDRGGDCEDSSILLASILQAMGYDVVLLSPPGHMAVGIVLPQRPGEVLYVQEGRSYLYAETTGDGWPVGSVPPAYQGKPTDFWPLAPRAIATLQSHVETRQGAQGLAITVSNIGTADTAGATVQVLREIDGAVDWTMDCTWPSLAPTTQADCWVDLPLDDLAPGAKVVIRVEARMEGVLHDADRYIAS